MKSLDITDLEITHSTSADEVSICKSFTESFKEGEIIGLFGPNGSGKSSLIKVLAGIDKQKLGSIDFNPEGYENTQLAYIPQNIESSFFQWSSIYGNLTLSSKAEVEKSVIDSLWNDFDISFNYSKRPSECSGGMLQQAAIVRAFVNNPDVIIADEPFSALDVDKAKGMKKVFREKVKSNGSIALLSLHSLNDFLSVCDRLILIPNKPFSSSKEISGVNQILKYNNTQSNIESFLEEDNSLIQTVEKLLK